MRTKKVVKLSLLMTVITIVTAVVFCFAGCKKIGAINEELYSVNGYQQWTDHKDLALKDKNAKLTTVDDMFKATGLKLSNAADKKQIAEYIYNLAVDNYGKIKNKAYMISTQAGVEASEIKSIVNLATFNVVLRSNYTQMTGSEGSFGQTISGVEKLELSGALGGLGNMIKGAFGYNIQTYSDSNISAMRRANDGGYDFISDKAKSEKYILGSTASFPSKVKGNWGEKNSFVVKAAEKSTASESDSSSRPYPWSPLTESSYAGPEYTWNGHENKFVMGSYGDDAPWATYNFSNEYLDDSTTVEYDKATKTYTLTMVVKKDMTDEACKFAKGALVQDTQAYVRLDQPKYVELINKIQIYENGLIKCWDREEKLGSELQAELIVLGGTCDGGGYCSNTAKTVFSYAEVDTNAKALAARYWPELGNEKIVKDSKLRLDLSGYVTLDEYVPNMHR